jgi:hypothetical protein
MSSSSQDLNRVDIIDLDVPSRFGFDNVMIMCRQHLDWYITSKFSGD